MKITIGPNRKPPASHLYGDNYERGLDPWHADAFPDEYRALAPIRGGKRREGWFLLDGWGNPIGFYPDGCVVAVKEDSVDASQLA